MNKLYSVHDHWTDINKKNDVDIESINGVITGIKVNGEDYSGGITWESVYSGTIDPDGEVRPFTANVSLTMTASDTIKVVYDNTEYILPKQIIKEHICYGATAYSIPKSIDFSNCPFLIQVMPNTIRVYTETAGTHTLTISEPASGGGESSDFSIATLTLTNTTKNRVICEVPCYRDGVKVVSTRAVALGAIGGEPSTATFNVICETNGATLTITTADITATTTGNIQYIEEQQVYIITGDCSITLAGSLH